MDDSEEDQLDKWLAFGSSPKDQLPSFAAANPMPEASDGVNNEADDYSMILEENERRAKFGFNAAHFLTTSPLASPTVWAPCLTIPPGIDPADLLDCPIMLPNSQLSPPTGTFSLPPYNHDSSMRNLASSSTDGERAGIGGSSFRFMPPGSPVSLPWFSSSENQVSASCNRDQSLGADVDYQTLASGQLPFDFEIPSWFVKEAPKAYAADSHTDVHVSCSRNVNANYIASQTSQSGNGEGAGMHHVDQKGTFPSMGMTRTFEDGYNWTKYGQKKLNGGGRTYYKCTHPNCQVRKRVERSHEGQITEIIYVGGDHNHPKPQPPRWSVHGSVFSYNEMPVMGENSGSCVKIDGGSLWRNFQLGYEDIKGNSYWRADGLERTLSTSVVTKLSDLFSTHKGKSICAFESAETPELSSTPASHDDDEDGETQGSISLGDDADDDGPDSKRRKKENCLIETTTSFRDFSEGRVVIQVESEVDIPNDGYRWRKYGQKAIRGSLKPRSYLKCNTAGCSVRKQVERASDDQKCVLITYDGRHNHEVPAGRNSSRVNSDAGNSPPPAPTRSTLSLPRTTNKPKNKRRVEDPAPHFERNPKFNNQFPRPPVLGNYHNDSDIGASSIYPMRFPPLQSSMLYPSFGLNSNRIGIHQPSLNAPGLPGLPSSLSLSAPRFANLASAGVDFSSHGIYSSPVRPFIAGQQPSENDMRFIRPIQEQNDGNPYDARLPTIDHASASSSSSSSSSSFGLNSNRIGIHQRTLNAPGLPGLLISLSSSVPRFGNLASAGVDSVSHGIYSSPVRPFIAGQQPSGSDMRFFRPIQEQNDDNPYDARLPTVDHHASAASSSSIDSQMMDNFPPYIAGQQPSESDLRFIRLIQELNDDNPYDARLLTVDHHASAPSSSSSSIDSQMMDSFPP